MKKGARVLVIEDNREVRENIIEILELDGYQTLGAPDGKVGVTIARENVPDLILCDIMMPELDGYGVVKIVKQDERLKDIPFLFLTAKSEKQDFRRAMSLGADDFITKPFDDIDLLESVEVRLKLRETNTAPKWSSFWYRGMKMEEINQGIDLLRKRAQNKVTKRYEAKESIFKSGEYPLFLFFVKKGVLKMSITTDTGKEMITCLNKEKDLLGVVPYLLNEAFRADCSALVESEIELIPVTDCENLVRKDPGFLSALNFILAHQNSYFASRNVDLAYSTVRKKVANALLLYQEAFGLSRFPCLRDDLSGLAAVAKETLIRTLSDFKKEGLIHVFLHEIEILEEEKIRRMLQ